MLSRTSSFCLGLLLTLFAYPIQSQAEGPVLPFKIGISAPLSGVLAEYGVAVKNGVALAQQRYPEKFTNVEIIFEDSQWDPKTAIQAFNTLREIKKVDLIYNWGNPTSEAVAPIAERYGMPTIAMSSDPSITKGRSHIIRSINAASELGALLARHLQTRGFKKLGVVVAENSYVRGLFNGLQEALGDRAQIEVLERCSMDQQDFRSLVSKLKGRSFDAFGVFLISGQVSSFYRQLANQGVRVPTFGADFLDSRNEIVAAGSAIEGAVHPNFDVTDDFLKLYLARYGNDVQIPFAANAHDVVLLLASLFANKTALDRAPEAMLRAIKAVREFPGANGTFSVLEQEQGAAFHYPLIMKQARGGNSVKIVSGES